MQENKSANIRWFYLALGVLAMLFAGIIYAWSILKAPFANEFRMSPSALAMNFTITMCFFCFGGLAGAAITKKLGTIKTLIDAAILAALGFVCTSFLQENTTSLLYLTYGVMAGFGIGIAYNVLVSTVSAWFVDKKGLCSGFLMMGFGTSALVIGNAADALMKLEGVGWRTTYMLLGGAIGLVLIVAALFLRKPDASVGLPVAAKKHAAAAQPMDLSTAQVMKRASFWLAFLMLIGLGSVGSSVISFARDLSLSVGASAALATSLVGVLSVFNGLGRIIAGALFDGIGQRKTMCLANVTTIAAAGVILIAIYANSLPLCVVGLCLTGMSYGSCPTIIAAFSSTFYGMKYFSSNVAVMNCNLIFASFLATASNSLLSASGGYAVPFTVLLGLAIVAFVLSLIIRKP